jgi:hypothetical protein
MSKMRIAGAAAALTTSVALLAACGELIGDPSFDRWCGEMLCNWELNEGRIERVQTWHAHDYAVGLMETPTTLSQLSEEDTADCLRVDMIVDTEERAQLSLELDFNDDGTADVTRPIPALRWKRMSFDIYAPERYAKVRFIVRKLGEGRAVLAQLRARESSGCTGPRVELRAQGSGAACSEAAQCSLGLCTDGRCSSCREDTDCEEAEQCVSGACSACREDADCGAGERCVWREARSRGAGRMCIPEAQELERGLLEWCDRDADCYGTVCGLNEGAASSCGLPCGEDESCPEGLACQPVFDTRGVGGVTLQLCVGAVVPGARCSNHIECASGQCCHGWCARPDRSCD